MNSLSLNKKDYMGSPSTLCKGCGHDAITAALVTALYELSVDPQEVIKLSGIGCSSKTPNYFLNQSFGFNSIHGRMASLATGVHLSQPKAKLIGISGDGDTASIGLGGFLHLVRRNVPIVYVIANNGVYGLTKGQFSATSELHDISKSKVEQSLPEMDMAFQALSAGCDFVARAFSGDQKQLKKILEIAFYHKGTAVIDVISPCVAYGNHVGFSKGYNHTQEINHPLHEIDLITEPQDLASKELEYKLIPLEGSEHDVASLESALELIMLEKKEKILHTGILYKNSKRKSLADAMKLDMREKFNIPFEELRLSQEKFNAFNEAHKI